ncbi:glycogen-binding domain-containing protein [Roseisolibacter sp. H3M3-2]|uniref:glycogen-binding domain-containing protein n=1 Tax=Roseisolibacter sp. H3M3-2 TaxID=3031323 RepID=UPI0023DA6D8F|nr:glycogen-binding domain-containing protein [Roseisolibacter sp. H3M3-2]MDF1505100.1 glycogen-binding domain-containing protein [Roseisolibacter sp. H3M3-2]
MHAGLRASSAGRPALLLLGVLGTAGGARAAGAQFGTRVTAGIDVGAASVGYDEFERASLVSVTPSVRVEGARTMFVARGAYSRFETGSSALQGSVAGSIVSPAFWRLRAEAFATASATRYRDNPAASNVNALGRLHFATPTYGVWGGAGAGFVAQGQFFPDALYQLDAGAWRRIGRTVYAVSATPTWVGAPDALGYQGTPPAGRLDYTDYGASMRWQHPSAEFVATAGLRADAGPDRIPGAKRWLESWTTVWVTRRLAIVGGAGAFPTDVQQGLPGGRYASVALRVATGRPPVNDPAVRAELTLPYELNRLRRGRLLAERFTVADDASGLRVITVRVPDARYVELMADFTDWLPAQLQRVGEGEWRLAVAIAPGVHRVNLRVDGGAWTVPPGLNAVRDDFGGEVGLLIVR